MSTAPSTPPNDKYGPGSAEEPPVGSPFRPTAEQPPQLQFGLRMLLMIVAVVSVVAAGLAGLMRARHDPQQAMFVILLVVAAPLVLMALISGGIGIVRWVTNPKNRKRW